MALTPSEKLKRRATDPYFGLAEKLAMPSLAQQKSISLATAGVEKNRVLDPVEALANETAQVDGTDLIDIAEAGLYEGWEQLFDFFTGGNRPNEEILREADIKAGVSIAGRKRLLEDPNQEVAESLAGALHSFDQGEYLDAAAGTATAAGQAIVQFPATLAASASAFPELGAGALLSRFGGKALVGRRVDKTKKGIKRFFEKVDVARDNLAKNAAAKIDTTAIKAIKGIPKAAVTVSLLSAEMTQRNDNDFFKEHGRYMNFNEKTSAYTLNMLATLPTPGIIRNLILPDFRKQLKTEARTLLKNIKGGSNFKQIMLRVMDGTKKITKAGGAEFGQEYFQTWAEQVNVQMGPDQRKTFWKSIKELIGDEDNQLQALVGAFLGGGAGLGARAAISVPAVAAGATLDTAKGTAKVAAKVAVAGTKKVALGAKRVFDAGAFKVLSQEERDIISSEFESNKAVAGQIIEKFESNVEQVKSATTIEQLRANPEIAKEINKRIEERGLTNDDLKDRKILEGIKADLIRAYRGDIGIIKTRLQFDKGINIARKSAANIKEGTVSATVATFEAISPGVDAVVDTVKKHINKENLDKAIKAVKDIRSSTALGMIEIAVNAGKAETKSILEAANSLTLEDLQRTTAVISEFNKDLARDLQRVVTNKETALGRTGVIVKSIVNKENIDKRISEASGLLKITGEKIAAISSALSTTVASTIEDLPSLEQVEKTLRLVERSESFKKQIDGAMSSKQMAAAKRKMFKARIRLEKEAKLAARNIAEKTVDVVKTAVEKATPVVKKATDDVKEKVDQVTDKLEAAGKERARKKTLDPTFRAVMEGVAKALANPEQAKALADSAPDLLKQMKKFGIETRADFEVFVEEFPELQINMDLYDKLEAAYPTNVVVDEVVDIFTNKIVDTVERIKKAYNNLNPPECKI
jgi:hypothetical protein